MRKCRLKHSISGRAGLGPGAAGFLESSGLPSPGQVFIPSHVGQASPIPRDLRENPRGAGALEGGVGI